jgi:hypothetical protein
MTVVTRKTVTNVTDAPTTSTTTAAPAPPSRRNEPAVA